VQQHEEEFGGLDSWEPTNSEALDHWFSDKYTEEWGESVLNEALLQHNLEWQRQETGQDTLSLWTASW
jgi:hypothetical protein